MSQELFDALCAPFPTDIIDWRIGSTTKDKSKGMALAYVDARAVMDRFDGVCGVDGWQCNYTPTGNGSIVCNIGVRTGKAVWGYPTIAGGGGATSLGLQKMADETWVFKANGAGKTDFEAEKGMYSDAFKRAAVMFGVARYLYDLDSPWVELENDGKKFTKAALNSLNELHDKAAQKVGWGERAGVIAYKVLLHEIKTSVTQPHDVEAFRERHKGMIPQLPVAMRKNLLDQLDRIGGPQQEAAQ